MAGLAQYNDESSGDRQNWRGNTYAPYVILVDPTTGDGIGGTTPINTTIIGMPDVEITGLTPTSGDDFNKTVPTAATPVQLSATSVPCTCIIVEALFANTGLISIGLSDDTTPSGTVKGKTLAAGDPWVIEIDDLNKVWVNSTVDGEGISGYYTV